MLKKGYVEEGVRSQPEASLSALRTNGKKKFKKNGTPHPTPA